jgi:hypothetical protein
VITTSHIKFILRILMAGVFIGASLPKIMAPGDFALAMFRYHLMPDGLINITAMVLPCLEIVAALAMILPAWRAAGTTWLITMLSISTVAIFSALVRGLDIDCGCFTLKPGQSVIGWGHVFRNLLLMGVLLWAGRREPFVSKR